MDNRRVLIAVLLSMIVVIGWQLLFPPPPVEPPPEPAAVADDAERPAAAEPSEAGEVADVAADPAETGPAVESAPPAAPIEATAVERVVLEGPGFEAVFTNRGAQLESFRLESYRNARGEPLDLVRERTAGPYPFGLVGSDGREHPTGDALFAVEREEAAGRPAVRFVYRGPLGDVEKRFEVREDGLLGVRIAAADRQGWGVVLGPGVRNPTDEELDRRFERRTAVWAAGDEVDETAADDEEETRTLSGIGLDWVGVEDTYFLVALIPRGEVDRALLVPHLVVPAADDGAAARFEPLPPGDLGPVEEDLFREMQVVVRPTGGELDALAYLGSKDYEHLSSLGYGLEQTVRFGFFGIFARPLLVGLKWIYENVVANYGWAIVLMTVFIKILLLPFTHKSYVSMQKMQELAPRMKAIRAKYKLRDKKGRPDMEAQRKMNEEVQALYRSEGVNPIGGCLPMLLQFPVLLAFYNLLLNAVELRGAPWLLWIDDLSIYDPYFVLPLVMGAVQFAQQRLAPAAGDPMQRRIMLLMPVFFTVLFLKFPSGLVLYWLTNNVLTLVQQAIYQRLRARQTAAPAAA